MAGININRTTAGVSLPAQVSSEIWGMMVEQSAVMQAARQISLPGSGITIPVITGDAAAGWVAETDEKPVSRATLDNKLMTPYTLAVIEPFSNQFRRDLPSVYAELARRLPFSLAKVFDATVAGAVAAPGANFDTLATSPQMVVDATATFADMAAVVNAIAAAGGDLTGWIANSSLHGLLLTTVDAFGRQIFVPATGTSRVVGSVFGAPVVKTRGTLMTSAAIGDGIGIAGDWANSAVWGSVEGVQISISDQATIQDGATSINLWQRDMFAVRAEIEVGFRVRDVNHFVQINDGVIDA